MALALVVLASTIALSSSQDKVTFNLDSRTTGETLTFHGEGRTQGESLTFQCTTQKDQEQVALYKNNRTKIMHVSWINQKTDLTTDGPYQNRINITGLSKELFISITQLRQEDSGVYWCEYTSVGDTGDIVKIMSNEVVALLVKRPEKLADSPTCNNFILVLFSIISAVVFLMFSIMLAFYVIPKIKTISAGRTAQTRANDSVYEVMNTTLRRT